MISWRTAAFKRRAVNFHHLGTPIIGAVAQVCAGHPIVAVEFEHLAWGSTLSCQLKFVAQGTIAGKFSRCFHHLVTPFVGTVIKVGRRWPGQAFVAA